MNMKMEIIRSSLDLAMILDDACPYDDGMAKACKKELIQFLKDNNVLDKQGFPNTPKCWFTNL